MENINMTTKLTNKTEMIYFLSAIDLHNRKVIEIGQKLNLSKYNQMLAYLVGYFCQFPLE